MNKKLFTAVTVAATLGLMGTAQASTLGDNVSYGKVVAVSCNSWYCNVDVRNSTTGVTVRTQPTLDARIRYCEDAGLATFALVNLSNINKLKTAQAEVAVIWSKAAGDLNLQKDGAVTCK